MSTIVDLYKQLFGRSQISGGNVIDMSEHGRTGGVSTGQGFKYVQDTDTTIRIATSGNYTYISEAKVGSTTSEATWQCYRIDEDGNVLYADGNPNYDNIADNATSLTYS